METNKKNPINTFLWLGLLGVVLFIPYLGAVHLFDWDEINFAESAREMLLSGNYGRVQINFRPFWEKPPLFIWFQALSMKLFGVNEFSARFPNAIIGVVSLLLFYHIGTKWNNKTVGIFWALGYIGSFLPHLYFKSGIIDPAFNLFIFLGYYFVIQTVLLDRDNPKRKYWAVIGGLCLGLAVLTKGPAAILITALSVLFFIGLLFALKQSPLLTKIYPKLSEIVLFGLGVLFISALWFGYETLKNGTWYLENFISYQIRLLQTEDAGHGGPIYYHALLLLIGCFPMSIFFFNGLKANSDEQYNQKIIRFMMLSLFFAVLILFSLVKTKIVHYSSMCYIPLTYIGALGLNRALKKDKVFLATWQKVLFGFLGFSLSISFILVAFIEQFKRFILPLVKDKFAVANLSTKVIWGGYEWLSGVLFLVTTLFILIWIKNKKGERLEQNLKAYLLTNALSIFLLIVWITPKVEGYSQRAAIEFFKSQIGKNTLVEVKGYKSYAHLFYTQKPLPTDSFETMPEYIWRGVTPKKVYYVSKNINEQELLNIGMLRKIGQKNGFVFYELIK